MGCQPGSLSPGGLGNHKAVTVGYDCKFHLQNGTEASSLAPIPTTHSAPHSERKRGKEARREKGDGEINVLPNFSLSQGGCVLVLTSTLGQMHYNLSLPSHRFPSFCS